MNPEKLMSGDFTPPDFNFGAHDWIIKPIRKLLGLMINKCFLNTQTRNPPAMQVWIFFYFYLIQTSLIREIKKKSSV